MAINYGRDFALKKRGEQMGLVGEGRETGGLGGIYQNMVNPLSWVRAFEPLEGGPNVTPLFMGPE